VKEDTQKLIENTIKDILLGNAALTFLFAFPLTAIAKTGLTVGLWGLTCFVLPGMLATGVWVVARVKSHAYAFFNSEWARVVYVVYALASTEILLVYSIVQIVKTLLKAQ